MKFSQVCSYKCIHCQGKLDRVNCRGTQNQVVFFCPTCMVINPRKKAPDKELNSAFTITFNIKTGALVFATMDFDNKLLTIDFESGVSHILDVNAYSTSNKILIPTSKFDLTNLSSIKKKIQTYLVFS